MTLETADILALRDLAFAYATAIDERDDRLLVSLFTADGRFGVFEPGRGEPLMTYSGVEELIHVMRLLDPYGDTMHVMTNHRVSGDGPDAAQGVVYCQAHHLVERDGSLQSLVMTIRYVDRYRREGGSWRISDRRCVRYWTELRPVLDERAAF